MVHKSIIFIKKKSDIPFLFKAGKPQFNTRKRTVKAKRLYCELCDKTCNSDFQWHQHCAAKRHATKLSSESKRTWNYRLPPFVGSAEEFRMCRE